MNSGIYCSRTRYWCFRANSGQLRQVKNMEFQIKLITLRLLLVNFSKFMGDY